jgi:hypothetical protein
MNERLRVVFLTGCAFLIGLHSRTAGRLIADGWRGPYSASGPAAKIECERAAWTAEEVEHAQAEPLRPALPEPRSGG